MVFEASNLGFPRLSFWLETRFYVYFRDHKCLCRLLNGNFNLQQLEFRLPTNLLVQLLTRLLSISRNNCSTRCKIQKLMIDADKSFSISLTAYRWNITIRLYAQVYKIKFPKYGRMNIWTYKVGQKITFC